MALRILLFLMINFGGLALGALITNPGISSDWYANLEIAPWTPPGWVFGAAWTTIMICFAVFMVMTYEKSKTRTALIGLFTLQWILNVSWNLIFFKYQAVLMGLIVIAALTILMGYFCFASFKKSGWHWLLVTPYFIWLLIATSLNAYIYLYN